MALRFDEVGTKYRDRTLAFDFGECKKDGTRPRFTEVGWFLRKEMKLEEGDVTMMGGHDSQRYFFVRMCSEERADEVHNSMRGGVAFGQGFEGKAFSFKTNGQMKELTVKNVNLK